MFLSRFDLFKGGHVRYHVDRVAREAGKVVGNGFTEVYVNAKDGSVLAELMDVFVRDDAYSDRFPITSRCKRRYKETEEGQRAMCEIMERIAEEERRQGRKQGRRQGRREGLLGSILALLADKGGATPELKARISRERDEAILFRWLRSAAKADSVEQFEQMM